MLEDDKKKCGYKRGDGATCGRELYDDKHCIFHSKDLEGKKDVFETLFWREFEWQEKNEERFNFSGFVFPGDISFKEKYFKKTVFFNSAKFYGKADFEGAEFCEYADFTGVHFLERVSFWTAGFSGFASFRQAILFGECDFSNIRFSGSASFDNAKFYRLANFRESEFSENTLFRRTQFLEKVSFRHVQFLGKVLFLNVDLRDADLQDVSFSNTDFTGVKYNRHARYRGIHFSNCYGSPMFIRFAKDQDYIEEFRNSKFRWPLYVLWLVFADCGRSFFVWALWSVLMALGFGCVFFSMGPEAFKISGLSFSLETMVYYSTVTFTTLGFGDITPITPEAARWVMMEVITGYIMLGGLISILANKLARRS